jgi:hypothetical protein
VANGFPYGWVESMRKGELFLKPWAAPTVRSAAPIDLNNMAVNVNVLERNKEFLSILLFWRRACPNKLSP